VDGVRYPAEVPVEVKKGEHDFFIAVTNLSSLPAAFLGGVVETDGDWYTMDIDEKRTPVGHNPHYRTLEDDPGVFFFSYQAIRPRKVEKRGETFLYDFGRETFGHIRLTGVKKDDEILVVYGESQEEATDPENALIWEKITGKTSYLLTQRAFRFLTVTGTTAPKVTALYEYIDLPRRGSFACDDPMVNQIWEMSAYTFHLNTREVYLDGIKRDRWLWSGDAYQSYKVNRALFHDQDGDRRTILALCGKECREHLNTITDYSFYWVLSIWDYYHTYGDRQLVDYVWPRAVERMAFAGKRTDEHGLIVKKGGDWIFIDWADLDKDGPIAAEQILYIAALEAMVKLADLVGEDGSTYAEKAKEIRAKLDQYYWDEEQGGYISSFTSGRRQITRHANSFALLYDIATPEKAESIVKNVLLNPEIPPITTPYFEGFELDLMGRLGKLDYIEGMLHSYWQKMLELGATTVWEEFDPKAESHYAMYGNKFGKSLCHAWGSTPVYLLARYYLGVYGTGEGEKTFEVDPHLGGFGWLKGEVPLRNGSVKISLTPKTLKLETDLEGGTLLWKGQRIAIRPGKKMQYTR